MIDYKDPKAVLEVCGKATEGPWNAAVVFTGNDGILFEINTDAFNICEVLDESEADFIALARTALPYWVEEAERMRAENEMLKSVILNNSEVIVNTPELPESFVINSEVAFLQAENARLREENDMQRASIQELNRGKAEFWNCFYCGIPNLQRHEVCKRCGKERQG